MTEPLHAPIVLHRYRYLFSDGKVVDVIANRADSVLTEWVYQQSYGTPIKPGVGPRVEGCADLGMEGGGDGDHA